MKLNLDALIAKTRPGARQRAITAIFRSIAKDFRAAGCDPVEDGLCGDVADAAWTEAKEKEIHGLTIVQDDDFGEFGKLPMHRWIYDRETGLHHDIRRPEGVPDWRQLPDFSENDAFVEPEGWRAKFARQMAAVEPESWT